MTEGFGRIQAVGPPFRMMPNGRGAATLSVARLSRMALRWATTNDQRATKEDTVAYGPAELLVVKFPGNRFRGEILPALADLVESRTIRLIDLLVVVKDADEAVTVLEAKEAFPDGPIDVLVDEARLLGSDDVDAIAEQLEADSSAAILLFEHLWAVTFVQALRDAGGELIMQERIPAAAVEEVELAQRA
jgi:hypothetical protein